MAPFSKEDKFSLKVYVNRKAVYDSFKTTKSSVNRVLVKLRKYDTVDRCLGGGRQRIVHTDENIDVIVS